MIGIEEIYPLAVEFRRYFHQHPEFAMQEVETQRYIAEVLPKIEWLKKQREAHGYTYEIEIDGGINADTAKLAAKAGADILVSGSSVFKASDPKDMIARMHGAEN